MQPRRDVCSSGWLAKGVPVSGKGKFLGQAINLLVTSFWGIFSVRKDTHLITFSLTHVLIAQHQLLFIDSSKCPICFNINHMYHPNVSFFGWRIDDNPSFPVATWQVISAQTEKQMRTVQFPQELMPQAGHGLVYPGFTWGNGLDLMGFTWFYWWVL